MASFRIKATEAAHLCGITSRSIRNLAAQGKIPGAARIGNSWTFDRAHLIKFISNQEAQVQVQCRANATSLKLAKPGISVTKLTDANVEKAYAQAMSKLRGR